MNDGIRREPACFFEKNKLFSTFIDDLAFANNTVPTEKDVGFLSPEAVIVVDNRFSSSAQSSTIAFTDSVTSSETLTITQSQELSTDITISQSIGFEFQFLSSNTEISVSVGRSFTEEFQNSNTIESSETVSRNLQVTAAPFTKVTGRLFYKVVEYGFDWSGPVRCTYTFDTSNIESGEEFSGTVGGSQAIPQVLVDFVEEAGPTPAPSSSGGICFSAHSTVNVQGRGELPMSDVQVGDMVQVSENGDLMSFIAWRKETTRPRTNSSKFTSIE